MSTEITRLEADAAQALVASRAGEAAATCASVVAALELADGLALGVQELAARWELLGDEGVRMLLASPAELFPALTRALAERCAALPPAVRRALEILCLVEGELGFVEARALLGAETPALLEALRHPWLVVPAAGRLRVIGPARWAVSVGEEASRAHLAWVLAGGASSRGEAEVQRALDIALQIRDARAVHLLLSDLRARACPPHVLDARYGEALARFGPSAPLLCGRAHVRIISGDLDGAEASLRHAERLATGPEAEVGVLRQLGTLGMERGDRALAVASLDEAARRLDDLGDRAAAAVARGELAMVHLHFSDHDLAASLLDEALAALELAGSAYPYAHLLASRAMLGLDRGTPEVIDDDLDEALDLVRRIAHPYGIAYVLACVGLVRLARGHTDAARAALEEGLAVAEGHRFGLLALRMRMRLAGVAALEGDELRWRAESRAARRLLASGPDATSEGVLGLYHALRDAVAGRVEAARAAMAGAGQTDVLELDEEARLLRRLIARRMPKVASLVVTADAEEVRLPEGRRLDLGRHAAARRVLGELVRGWFEQPGIAVSRDRLFTAGWPGDNIAPASAANRLRVEISRLRRAGLRPWLQTGEGGYLLDPDLVVERA